MNFPYAGYAMNIPSFNYYRRVIREESQQAANWVDDLPKEKWAQAYDAGRRWGHMTSNLVESMNNIYKGIRNMPISAMVKATYYRTAALFALRGHEAGATIGSGAQFAEKCMDLIKEEVSKSTTHEVTHFDRMGYTFSVRETIDHKEGMAKGEYKVDLQARWCDCGKFQALHMPCSHVIAACSSFSHDYSSYIDPVFRNERVYAVYNRSFNPVHHQSYWPPYVGFVLCPNLSTRRPKKGRPNTTRIRTEMDEVEKVPRKCKLCRGEGHYRTNCPNFNLARQ
jgi:hypothetical protein